METEQHTRFKKAVIALLGMTVPTEKSHYGDDTGFGLSEGRYINATHTDTQGNPPLLL